jgi:hypothetical protein
LEHRGVHLPELALHLFTALTHEIGALSRPPF